MILLLVLVLGLFYTIPFVIIVSMPNRRRLIAATLILGVPIIAFITFVLIAGVDLLQSLLFCLLNMICMGFLVGITVRNILLNEQSKLWSYHKKSVTVLCGFISVPAVILLSLPSINFYLKIHLGM